MLMSIKHLYYRLFLRRRDQYFKPVILITGCGSGIGWALAKLLYKEGKYRVVATARARSLEKLRRDMPETDRFWVRELDVTVESERENLLQEIGARWGGVNILVNNAGISYRSVIEHMSDEDELKQMATNYLGPMGLIRGVLPFMRKNGRGKIINVSSVSGMLAMPTMGSYTASKHALEGASEALWYEMRPYGVNVSLIQPGFIKSNSFRKVYSTAKSDEASHSQGPYHDYYSHMEPFIERMMNHSISNPRRIAKLILKVIHTESPPFWIPATLDAWIFYYLRRILPQRLMLPLLFFLLPGARRWAHRDTNRRHLKRNSMPAR
jgi:NAD(P)-dependent dehydrogenase (short-subunit alcohol dehydrogenase family)